MENCTLPLPPCEGDDTIFEYVVGEDGQWEHWSKRVRSSFVWE
jgi:dynein heavy chain